MRFFKRIAGFFGLLRDENHDPNDAVDDHHENDRPVQEDPRQRRPTKGFSVQVPVTVDRRSSHLGPVLVPCNLGQGGIQGFNWYEKRLRIDEDGDVADEFLDEVLPEKSGPDDRKPVPKLEVKQRRTRPAKVINQTITSGNILQGVEYNGRLQWV